MNLGCFPSSQQEQNIKICTPLLRFYRASHLGKTGTALFPRPPVRLAVYTTFPNTIELYASINISFTSRDFYSNDIPTGYGGDAFDAWTTSAMTHKVKETVHDLGDGSYRVEMRTQNETGTELFFVQRQGLNIPGSPFEVLNSTAEIFKTKRKT